MGADMDLFLRLLAIVTPALSGVCIYLLRDIRSEQKALRADMERLVRQDTCQAHRESVHQQIAALREELHRA